MTRRRNTSRKKITAFVSLAVTVIALVALTITENQTQSPAVGVSDPTAVNRDVAQTVEPSTDAGEPVVMQDDYFTIIGNAEQTYTPSRDGVVEYCPLDSLERAVCAYGNLTSELREHERSTEREDININPSGWPASNGQVSIPALSTVEGSSPYSGWLWNRSHLVADSLGGDATHENLVTGTRTQNVGSTQTSGQFSGGMAYTELIARDYLDDNDANACPLYYAATPAYHDDELVPRTVIVDVASCDSTIDIRVEVYNTAAGWIIDYNNAQTTVAP